MRYSVTKLHLLAVSCVHGPAPRIIAGKNRPSRYFKNTYFYDLGPTTYNFKHCLGRIVCFLHKTSMFSMMLARFSMLACFCMKLASMF